MRWTKGKTVVMTGTVAILMAVAIIGAMRTSGAALSRNFIAGWGEVINPSGDCTITEDDGKVTIALPGTDHALRPEQKRMNAPRLMQEMTGHFDIQVKVSGDFPAKAKSIVSGRRPYQDAGLLVWLDEKNNLKLSRAQIVDRGRSLNFFNLEFRHNGEYGEVALPKEARPFLQTGAVYLRLQIHAKSTTASVSTNGVDWVNVSLPGDDVPRKLQVGVLAENNTSSPLNVAFEEFSVLKSDNK